MEIAIEKGKGVIQRTLKVTERGHGWRQRHLERHSTEEKSQSRQRQSTRGMMGCVCEMQK